MKLPIVLSLILFSFNSHASNFAQFFSSSSQSGNITFDHDSSWTVPSGVTTITVQVIGGGGGGSFINSSGGGGGGGSCIKNGATLLASADGGRGAHYTELSTGQPGSLSTSVLTVTPGSTLSIYVGGGGGGGATSVGGGGGYGPCGTGGVGGNGNAGAGGSSCSSCGGGAGGYYNTAGANASSSTGGGALGGGSTSPGGLGGGGASGGSGGIGVNTGACSGSRGNYVSNSQAAMGFDMSPAGYGFSVTLNAGNPGSRLPAPCNSGSGGAGGAVRISW